jgi:16S rRNA (adenine1518-N6/adenine1519-N6)-dimethyltransferase
MIKKKSLGQNFLKSESALVTMVSSGKVTGKDFVVEIGPGEGALTQKLLETGCTVWAIEKDHRLIPILETKFEKEISTGKLRLREGDVLEKNIEKELPKKYKLIANIPYYITGQIIRMFLETKNQPECVVVLVQKEVAERIIARDGKESLLSLSVKIFGAPKLVRVVGRGAFVPQPNVDSAILSIENIGKPLTSRGVPWKEADERLFFKVIHAGFAHKRKQLLPNLSNLYKKEDLIKAFEKCGMSQKSRAEDISLETWIKLCQNLYSLEK